MRRAAQIDLATIETMDQVALQTLWTQLFDREPPRGRTTVLLRLEIAWAVQAASEGDLDLASKRLLRTHARKLARSKSISSTRAAPLGARLVREWRGETHTVIVVRDGYLWRGRAYASLTAIAQEITGLHRSGPRFFGLTKEEA